MQTPKTIPVPTALAELINSNNELLKIYQRELTNKIITANIEMMKLLGLNPEDGWRLDTNELVYTKVENDTPPVGE